MYNSIQHFNELGVKKIEEAIKKFIGEHSDLADLIIGLQDNLFELGRHIIKEVLEDMDEHLRNCGVRKKDWEIVRKDETGLLTSFGSVRYSRTYFKPMEKGKRRYLVDEIAGIKPHDRVSADVVINVIDEAIDSSYKKAGKKAAYVDEITKQAVMNKVHRIEIKEAPIRNQEKRDMRILYIEADEDHVSLQGKDKKSCDRKRKKISMPKLVYVHEGIDTEKSVGKRKVLKNVRYFGGVIASEDLWLQVAQYIDNQYKEESLETVYISGDGASWIRQGLNWIAKSKFVLDNHHLNNEAIYNGLRDALEWPDRGMLKKVFKKILELTDSDTKKEKVKEAQGYMLNNWDGIEIKAEKGYEIVGCSAEGHVSHVFSDRLSSRPRGWSEVGANQMAQLKVYKRNGGKIYDLVMAQKKKEQREKKIQLQDELIKSLRKSTGKYENAINTEITAIEKGHKTGLYKELRSIIGRCG